MDITWSGRLAEVGASAEEVASIQASYDDSAPPIRAALDDLVAGIDSAGLRSMLGTWRTGAGPFGEGFPGGGLPFGSHAAILTGDPTDDVYAISAGTGQKMASGGSPPSPSWLLVAWTLAGSYTVLSATRDANEAVSSASVLWPDGATGTFTTDTASVAFPGALDAYHVTYVYGSGPTTKTITQTAVTRDGAGAVTAQPALTVV